MIERKIKWGNWLFISLLAFFVGSFIELYRESQYKFLNGTYIGLLNNEITWDLILRMIGYFVISFVIFSLLYYFRGYFKYVDKYRYVVGFIIIILWTALELSGSSIGSWNFYIGNGYATNADLTSAGVILGQPRSIRSDEWNVFTALNFSQIYNGFNAVSDIIRGTATDVTTTYGNPCFALVTLFRPFLWGYILLGNAKGLAFFWIARTVFMFLASYELAKLYTKNNKYISVMVASLLTFSQTIQWWYAVNGLMEMFIFGQYALVLLHYLVYQDKLWKKIVICIGLVECAGGFMFAYYPAQEIPLAYVFLMLFIWDAYTNRKRITKQDVCFIIASVIVFALMAGFVLYSAKDTFEMVMNTVYPGSRVEIGGSGDYHYMFYWIISIFAPLDEGRITAISNASEMAGFYSLFPLGILWTLYLFIKKRGDLFSGLLVVLDVFFNIFYYVGFPEIIAKLTLMSNVTPNRLLVIIEVIDIMLLAHCASLIKKQDVSEKNSVIINLLKMGFIFIIAFVAIYYIHSFGCITGRFIWILAGLIAVIAMMYLLVINKDHVKKASIFLLVIISITGMMVNPLQKGTDVIYENDLTKTVASVVEDDPDAVWVVVPGGMVTSVPIMVGARTINCTNIYPNLELWSKLDSDGLYQDVYNRYAHITVNLVDSETNFNLIWIDSFEVNLNYKDLDTIGVDYVLTDSLCDNDVLEYVTEGGGYYIYHVVDNN